MNLDMFEHHDHDLAHQALARPRRAQNSAEKVDDAIQTFRGDKSHRTTIFPLLCIVLIAILRCSDTELNVN